MNPKAGDHAVGNVSNLIAGVFDFLCHNKDDREHTTLIRTVEVANNGMIGVFAAEGGQESLVKALDETVAYTNGVMLLGGEWPCRIQHTLIILDDSSGRGLSIGASQRLSNVLQGCIWLIAVVGTQLCNDTCADLPEAKL
jgi:hypothetical protein